MKDKYKTLLIVVISIVGWNVLLFLITAISLMVEKSKDTDRPIQEEEYYGGYGAECQRFDSLLSNTTDEELVVVLRYAISRRYVHNRHVDSYHNKYVMCTSWKRSERIFNKIADRHDLLQQIYPDVYILKDYLRWFSMSGEAYPDTAVSNSILRYIEKEEIKIDSEVHPAEYFSTPLLYQPRRVLP